MQTRHSPTQVIDNYSKITKLQQLDLQYKITKLQQNCNCSYYQWVGAIEGGPIVGFRFPGPREGGPSVGGAIDGGP